MKKTLMSLSLSALIVNPGNLAFAGERSIDSNLSEMTLEQLPSVGEVLEVIRENQYGLQAEQALLISLVQAYETGNLLGEVINDIPVPEGMVQEAGKVVLLGAEILALQYVLRKGTRLTNGLFNKLIPTNSVLANIVKTKAEMRDLQKIIANSQDERAVSKATQELAEKKVFLEGLKQGKPSWLRRGLKWSVRTTGKVTVIGAGIVGVVAAGGGSMSAVYFPGTFDEEIIEMKRRIVQIDGQLAMIQ